MNFKKRPLNGFKELVNRTAWEVALWAVELPWEIAFKEQNRAGIFVRTLSIEHKNEPSPRERSRARKARHHQWRPAG